ncbi:L-2-hydroxyglutarate dehydrogenase [Fusobacterium sp. DD29]|uniref:NAD(P)/FAD-dependent oxidoreductase n=1 Tax=unclassified Fusobacterium TaxID=2648384 RepID=UPI001B8C16B5|nr:MULTISPECIES: NAD(P)/FAD-dependent oxidoreductase [unclassified Fusobacterium]MBR8700968.1 L-2-hydroxyglutarate dehydrogenase [Fusobacterium sp. DD45]MBR8710844.1 L-2-hydroxyglutarate dehydrogenase [Fusobacterium sp. DD28]MBR8748499.1 L-2-hydroxyglutarate dehydrogenase [Fusobacterium sp. DD29]MBR8751319.1 L-2-hydroxyglutarate dehydrogenase [Fusobacterium sp. DD26]MBR8760766.1 L-2-hydroxyglutarate dehydrogenase [Fusobacterium sp. DD25]
MFDVIIIGAGIMGAATAYELAKYNLKVMVLEKEHDVSNGTSKANSGIVHAGYDATEGTLMAKYNALGNEMYEDLCKEIDAPFKRTGSFVLAFSEEDREHLNLLYNRGITNGIPGMQLLEREDVLKMEPNINPEVKAALYAPTAGVTSPWEVTIKLLENAVLNGAELKTDAKVEKIERIAEGFKVILSNKEELTAKVVVNAAGVYADDINNMVSSKKIKITPRAGEYFLLDKVQGNLVNKVIFQCPTKVGKGVLVSPTVHGNLIVGPTATTQDDKDYVGNTLEAFDFIKATAVKSVKNINFRDNIKNFSGLRAEADIPDFIIGEVEDVPFFFNIAGTKSPGLTSAPAIGLDVANMIVEKLGNPAKKAEHKKNKPHIYFMELSPEEKAEVIKKDPRYGRIICRCESITEGEIVDVIHRMVGAKTVDGIKKRCRPGMGRCQGGFCGPRVQEILARELHENLDDIVLDKVGSYILTGETKKQEEL